MPKRVIARRPTPERYGNDDRHSIRHVTKPGANLFLELGFSSDEAERLHAASRKQINDTRLLKEQLMTELSSWIDSII